MEWLLQKALESSPGKSYSPQQVAEMLDSQRNSIITLDEKIAYVFWLLLIIIASLETINFIFARRFENRLKKLKKTNI